MLALELAERKRLRRGGEEFRAEESGSEVRYVKRDASSGAAIIERSEDSVNTALRERGWCVGRRRDSRASPGPRLRLWLALGVH